jgi:enoyl-CoA hydratase/carnithine racemase
MCTAGAFYFVNESDVVICSSDATFFDSHVSAGLVCALEPIGLMRRVGLGETLRIALMGNDERVGADTALRIGLVSEVVSADDLWARAHEIAAAIAAKPPSATQGTVKAIWESLDKPYRAALEQGLIYTRLGNPIGTAELAERGDRRAPTPKIR